MVAQERVFTFANTEMEPLDLINSADEGKI
jgi:hypothetical protein